MKLENIYGHLSTIVRHKYWVMHYCFKARLYKQGILHDLSKFTPTEFIESVKYYNGTRSPIEVCKEKNGMSFAWLHHKGLNPHHYEYWQDRFDSGTMHIKMPYKYAIEMICDNLAASRAYNANAGKKFTYKGVFDWWNSIKDTKVALHPKTKRLVTIIFYVMTKMNSCEILNNRYAMNIIHKYYVSGDKYDDYEWSTKVSNYLNYLIREGIL